MEIEANRIGKLALLAAMTSREEEEKLKALVLEKQPNVKLAVTFISGTRNKIMDTITKSAVGCALQNNIVAADGVHIHAVMHATLEAIGGITNHLIESSLKLKMSIVSDGKWVAVALYGDSAIHPLTNHERAGLGIMNL